MTEAGPRYRVYVMDVSYFSGKLEAYLRYKCIPYERVEVGWRELSTRVRRHTGLARVPVVETSDGRWLQDTTPILDWMEARHPEGAVLPADPLQQFLSRLLEDYADEWMWRPALHYRWSYERDARLLSDRIAAEVMKDLPGPRKLVAWQVRRRQRRTYVTGDGVRDETRAHVEGVFTGALARLEAVLSQQRYLLGERPSLADFGFFASMFRHFALDPTPSRIMRDTAPAVFAWVARLWNARFPEEKGAWVPTGGVPPGWRALLVDAAETHLPYLHANAAAWRDGRRRFDVRIGDVTYRDLPCVRYRVWCRERLQQHFQALADEARPAVREALEACGAWEPLWRDGEIPSHLHEGEVPPECRPARPRPPLAWLRGDPPWNPVRG